MENTIKKCQIEPLQNMFNSLYSKYKFICAVDNDLWTFANGDMEHCAINILFFLKSFDCDFAEICAELNKLVEDGE